MNPTIDSDIVGDSDIIEIGTYIFRRHCKTCPSYFVSAFCSYRLFPIFGFRFYIDVHTRSKRRKVVTTHVSTAGGKESCSSDVFHVEHAGIVLSTFALNHRTTPLRDKKSLCRKTPC